MKIQLPPVEFFKALSDPTRLTIIELLRAKDALCVCDITAQLQQPQPTVSRHLTHLKRLGILTSERRGTWIWYSLAHDLPDWSKAVIRALPSPAIED
jgi:ArsR family transcriptional regulator